ncbi:MAG: leucine-rich repeat protein [Methanobrevibacter sp.]|nr:leucine-rich repeat protein [Methanobrevibacter sp.]
MPCSPEEKDLVDMFTCLKFIGWTDTKNSTIPYDFKRAKSIRDMTFYPIYEEKNVYDNECVLGKTYFHIETNENNQNILFLNSGVKLAGKITLPIELDGKKIHLLNTGIFSNQNDITHVFWKKGLNSLVEISTEAFNGCTNLIYFEMPDSVKTINNYAF